MDTSPLLEACLALGEWDWGRRTWFENNSEAVHLTACMQISFLAFSQWQASSCSMEEVPSLRKTNKSNDSKFPAITTQSSGTFLTVLHHRSTCLYFPLQISWVLSVIWWGGRLNDNSNCSCWVSSLGQHYLRMALPYSLPVVWICNEP